MVNSGLKALGSPHEDCLVPMVGGLWATIRSTVDNTFSLAHITSYRHT